MNSDHINAAARKHMARIKSLPCGVCGQPGPSEAHHIKQGAHYLCVAVCVDCHRSPVLGWHGQRRAWAVRKMDELDALGVTLARLNGG